MSKRNAKAVSSKRPFLPQRLQQRLRPGYLSEREGKSKNIPERIRTFFFLNFIDFKVTLTNLQFKKKKYWNFTRHRT